MSNKNKNDVITDVITDESHWWDTSFLFRNEALRHLLTMFALVGGFMYIGYLYGKTNSGNRNKYVS